MKMPHSGMGEIEKKVQSQISKSRYQKNKFFSGIEKSHIVLVKISLFRMKKFEINEPIQYKTFFQQSALEMSHFDILKAKKSGLGIV